LQQAIAGCERVLKRDRVPLLQVINEIIIIIILLLLLFYYFIIIVVVVVLIQRNGKNKRVSVYIANNSDNS